MMYVAFRPGRALSSKVPQAATIPARHSRPPQNTPRFGAVTPADIPMIGMGVLGALYVTGMLIEGVLALFDKKHRPYTGGG